MGAPQHARRLDRLSGLPGSGADTRRPRVVGGGMRRDATPDATDPPDTPPAPPGGTGGDPGGPDDGPDADPADDATGTATATETGPGGAGDAATDAEAEPLTLPPRVRQRVVSFAADALGVLAPEDIPGTLKPFARFTPVRRAKLAATPIAAALETDLEFRAVIAGRLRLAVPDLVTALEAGHPPAAADPFDVAAAAYLLRSPGWRDYVFAVNRQEEQTAAASAKAAADASLSRLLAELEEAKAAVRTEQEHHRAELEQRSRETAELRRQLRSAQAALRRAEAENRHAAAELANARAEAQEAAGAAAAENKRLQDRLAVAEGALEVARRTAREGRSMADVRLRLLLDTLLDATRGLRQELALPPVTELRPADTVAPMGETDATTTVPVRGLAGDDPAVLDHLLTLPQVHLIIDGYNVTKGGYPTLPLAEQRMRLLGGLAALAAQTGAEITCAFDGAAVGGTVPSAAPRGVRVLFSRPGESADDLIRRLVRAEPPGRPVVVVTSDREIIEDVSRCGARAVPSSMLLRRLSRG